MEEVDKFRGCCFSEWWSSVVGGYTKHCGYLKTPPSMPYPFTIHVPVEPLYSGHPWDKKKSDLIREVSLFQG